MIQNELKHYGVKGMKWGKTSRGQRDKSYRSTGIRSAMAKRSNRKVDESFANWNENSKRRSDAISKGKTLNQTKMQLENDPSNKNLKRDYKSQKSDYKKAMRGNTTYRKGQIKSEVGRDLSRKYLSEAKRVRKNSPNDQKSYSKLMNKYDVERSRARKAPGVAARRSKAKANAKRALTVTVKTAAAAGLVAGGTIAVNKYLSSRNVTRNGDPFRVTPGMTSTAASAISIGKSILGMFV